MKVLAFTFCSFMLFMLTCFIIDDMQERQQFVSQWTLGPSIYVAVYQRFNNPQFLLLAASRPGHPEPQPANCIPGAPWPYGCGGGGPIVR